MGRTDTMTTHNDLPCTVCLPIGRLGFHLLSHVFPVPVNDLGHSFW